jgi:hypothetical protein
MMGRTSTRNIGLKLHTQVQLQNMLDKYDGDDDDDDDDGGGDNIIYDFTTIKFVQHVSDLCLHMEF